MILILILILISILIIIKIYFINTEYFNNNIIFMNKNDIINFIIQDKDNYIKNLTIYDLYARHVSSHSEYFNLIINNCLDFTDEQKNIIIKYSPNNTSFKIALINDIYEEGYPHTREDIIFISPRIFNNFNNINKTIKHELVHIDQRYNKRNYKNYVVSRKRNTEPLIRANPDLDEYIYKDIHTNKELYYIYSSNKPNGINDIIKINNLEEHPFEIEAYSV